MSSRSTQLVDKNRVEAVNDAVSEAAIVVDVVHRRIHQGVMFQADALDPALANNASTELLLRVAAGQSAHTRFTARSSGDARVEIFEAPTTTADGTAVAVKNRNRFSSNTPDTLFFLGPTVTADGVGLTDVLVAAGTGGNAGGGSSSSFEEWILKTGLDYLVRVTNISGNASAVGVEIDFYEPPVTA